MNLNQQILPIMDLLELPMSVVSPLLHALENNIDNAKKELEKFKDVVKRQRRSLAKKYHPDKTTGNIERMQKINNIVDQLLKSEIRIPVQQNVVIYSYYSYGAGTYGSTTSYTSY